MDIIAKDPQSGNSVFGKNAFTEAGAMGIGGKLADAIIHDQIFGRLLNWLFLACIAVTVCVFFPVWAIIFIYCFFLHHKGTMEFLGLLLHMAIGNP